jgi:hypothetical protein
VRELGGHLVVEAQFAGVDEPVVVQAEAQQHRLLDPLVHLPLAHPLALGHAQAPGVQVGNDVLHGFAHLRCVGGVEAGARVPRGVDGGLELLGHESDRV